MDQRKGWKRGGSPKVSREQDGRGVEIENPPPLGFRVATGRQREETRGSVDEYIEPDRRVLNKAKGLMIDAHRGIHTVDAVVHHGMDRLIDFSTIAWPPFFSRLPGSAFRNFYATQKSARRCDASDPLVVGWRLGMTLRASGRDVFIRDNPTAEIMCPHDLCLSAIR